jgi:hypothetical protein
MLFQAKIRKQFKEKNTFDEAKFDLILKKPTFQAF